MLKMSANRYISQALIYAKCILHIYNLTSYHTILHTQSIHFTQHSQYNTMILKTKRVHRCPSPPQNIALATHKNGCYTDPTPHPKILHTSCNIAWILHRYCKFPPLSHPHLPVCFVRLSKKKVNQYCLSKSTVVCYLFSPRMVHYVKFQEIYNFIQGNGAFNLVTCQQHHTCFYHL